MEKLQRDFRKIVLIGPPNSGKGTVSNTLEKELQIFHISTGEIFRKLANEGSLLGISAREEYWGQGKLVPDNLTNNLVEEYLKKPEYQHGFVIDGFPRTFGQANFLDNLHPDHIPVILRLNNDAQLYQRAAGRVSCPRCRKVYNNQTDESLKPIREGFCDVCSGEKIIKRRDDDFEVFSKRLKDYRNDIEPMLIKYYGNRIIKIKANKKPIKVFGELFYKLNEISLSR